MYPRLAKLEAEGLVTHTTEGGRKVYAITDAGRAELADRSGELADLELEIRDSVAELAAEIRDDVRGAAGDLRREMRAAAERGPQGSPAAAERSVRQSTRRPGYGRLRRTSATRRRGAPRRRRCGAPSRSGRSRPAARRTRAAAPARRPSGPAARPRRPRTTPAPRPRRRCSASPGASRNRSRTTSARGDWPTGVREGLTELAKEFGEFGKDIGKNRQGLGLRLHAPRRPDDLHRHAREPEHPEYADTPQDFPAGYEPPWAHEESTGDPARDLDRLLDRFRDDIRDTARDQGVTEPQLREARRHSVNGGGPIGMLRAPKA